MAPKTALALLLVVCLAELACASPAPFHSRRSTNGTTADSTGATSNDESSSNNFFSDWKENVDNFFNNMWGKRSTDSSNSSSSNTTTGSDDTSSEDAFSEFEDQVEGFFGHLFGKRAAEFPADVFTTLYQEWANGRPDRSVTVRDTENSFSIEELFKEWLKGNSNKRSVTVRDIGNSFIMSDIFKEWVKGNSNKRSVTV